MSYGEDWDEIRKQIYQRDGFECRLCGAKRNGNRGAEIHAHHITPLSKRGTNNPGNLLTLCWSCHNAQHKINVSRNFPNKQPGGDFPHTPPKLFDIRQKGRRVSQEDIISMGDVDEPFSIDKYKEVVRERKRKRTGEADPQPTPNDLASGESTPNEITPLSGVALFLLRLLVVAIFISFFLVIMLMILELV